LALRTFASLRLGVNLSSPQRAKIRKSSGRFECGSIAGILANIAMNGRLRLWLLLTALAGIPRLVGAFLLPNTFGDAYVYIRDIGNLSTKIKTATFAITDLYGFWLPLYQFIAAVINVFIGNGFYVGKIVSAVFGIGVCLLVYAITLQVVEHRRAALMAFALIAVNPLHILTSTSALTDVPHAFFVMASLLSVLKRNWMVAAIFAALAGLTRVESWMLIALIPTLQFWKERRFSIAALLVTFLAPLFWFWVSWKATGDWLACFRARQQYHDWLLAQNPALGHFTFIGVLKDGAMFLSGVDVAVLIGVIAAAGLIMTRWARPAPVDVAPILPPLLFFFAFFALLVVAYLTHQQPIIFPRYGLILFCLGIPILAWTYFAITRLRPEWSRRVLLMVVVLCMLNASAQFAGGVGELNRYHAQRQVADYLRAHFDANSNATIFCDEGNVRVLSGIAEDRFVTSSNVPKDYDGFWSALAANKVEWLVISPQPGSIPAELFPWWEYGERVGPYESVFSSHTRFLPAHIWVYRSTEQNRER
jgi:hypothetical protein